MEFVSLTPIQQTSRALVQERLAEHDVILNSLQTSPFGVVVNRIYVRPGGSDSSLIANGTEAKPWATLQRAVLVPPPVIPRGQQYAIDMTGCTEVLPQDFTLPSWKSGFTTDSNLVNDPDFLFYASVVIQAIPQPAAILSTADGTISTGDVASQVADSVSGLITITLDAERAGWSDDALKGYLIEDAVGGGNNADIWASTSTTLTICTSGALTFPCVIKQPGATITGTSSSNTVAVGSTRGALRAVNCDSIGFSGLIINNSAGVNDPGLALGGNGAMFAQMCWLSSPTIQSFSPALGRLVRCWIKGAPTFSNFVTIQQSLCDGWTGTPFRNLIWFLARGCAFDGCVPLEPTSFMPGANTIGLPTLGFYFQNCAIANSPGATGDGVRCHGGFSQFTSCDVYGNGRDGIQVTGGAGSVQLSSCGSSGAANTRYGLNVQDGMLAKLDSATYTNSSLLAGTTAALKCGNLTAQSFSTWNSASHLAYDVTSVGASGAVGTGSQIVGN